ncbi:Deoxyribonuclease-2-beta [Coccomyxa sp. Obi]|nr:Deoxyribonuclease-2-beta [Coccomyxa sp. Obi]
MLLPILICASALVHIVAGSIGCQNAAGDDVDWWIALKAPEGSPYGYLDSTQNPPQWAYDPNSELAATSGNPLANTLQQIYSGGVSYLIYNDQPFDFTPKPKIDGKFHAHAKGVFAFSKTQGFWLTHSNPNFPDNPKDSSYSGIYNCSATDASKCGPAQGQQRYGQHYLCLTMDHDNLEKAAQALQMALVVVASSDLEDVQDDYPEMAQIVSGYLKHKTGEVPVKDSINQELATVGSEPLLQFAMSPTEIGDDVYLYEELIEPKLKSGMWVETWKEGKDFVSYCPSVKSSLPKGTHFKYETRTINKIFINQELQWTNPRTRNSGDHSKWAITHAAGDAESMTATNSSVALSRRLLSDDNAPGKRSVARAVKVLCMADINRAGHQLQRGGGAVCFSNNAPLWNAFLGIVAEVGACGEL